MLNVCCNTLVKLVKITMQLHLKTPFVDGYVSLECWNNTPKKYWNTKKAYLKQKTIIPMAVRIGTQNKGR